MSSTARTPASALALLALLAAGCGGPEAPPPARNLLLISVDTLRADELGAYGAQAGTTPNLDRLAQGGVVFETAVSASSWTLPSFASILTSTYPSTHQVDDFRDALDPSFETLGEVLSAAGFRTAAVTSHAFVGPRYGMDQGIAEFDDALIAGNRQAELKVSSPGVTEGGLRMLEELDAGAERWFLWLHYFDPHYPYIRHGEPDEAEGVTREDYRGDIAFTDRWIGEVLDELERRGLAEDTLVVLVSDHGEEFREREKLRHGYTLFGEVVRVPLVVRAPGVAPRRVRAPVGGVDVMPTLLDLLGLRAPEAAVGRSLVPAMLGVDVDEEPLLSELQLHDDYRADSLVLGRWKLVVDHTGRATVGFAAYAGGPPTADSMQPHAPEIEVAERVLLYDVEADPAERRDVAAEHPEVVAELRAVLEALKQRARAMAGDSSSAVEHSADELEVLRQLGYAGDAETSDDPTDE